MTHLEAARLIRAFLDGSIGRWDWDDFISVPKRDKKLEAIRLECAGIPETFPAESANVYCNADGISRLAVLAAELESKTGNPRGSG